MVGGMAWLVKCLSYKHTDWAQNPSNHLKRCEWQHRPVTPVLGRWSSLVSQSSYWRSSRFSERSLRKPKRMWVKGRHQHLTSGFHTHKNIHTCAILPHMNMYTYAHVIKKEGRKSIDSQIASFPKSVFSETLSAGVWISACVPSRWRCSEGGARMADVVF